MNDPIVFQFFNEIGIIDQLARTRLERALPDGLKAPQFGVLNHFARLGGRRSPAELARAFQVTRGAMTNTLQRLEARGLVKISADPRDGRAKQVEITESGRRVREEAIAAVMPLVEGLSSTLDQRDLADVLPLLRKVRVALDSADDR